jgi:hypothetical protein
MRDLLNLIRWMLVGLFRSRTALRAENLALRHQLNVLHRRSPKRPVFSQQVRSPDLICLYHIAPQVLDALRLSSLGHFSAGIVLAFACSGGGSLVDESEGRRCISRFAD